MPDVAFLPIHYAYLDIDKREAHIYYPPDFEERFDLLAVSQKDRSAFEKAYSSHRAWAEANLEDYLQGRTRTVVIADEKHPIRLGGSTLNLIIDSSTGTLWVALTVRGTNKGQIKCPPNLRGKGQLKNAGGLPNDVTTHRAPGLVGIIEGIEEIIFVKKGSILSPYTPLESYPKFRAALEASKDRLQEYFKQDFQVQCTPHYKLFRSDSKHSLVIHRYDGNPVHIDNCVLTWNPGAAALEVTTEVYRLSTPLTDISAILTGDGIGKDRFAEDVCLAKVEDLSKTPTDISAILTGDGIGKDRFAEDVCLAKVEDLSKTPWGEEISTFMYDTTQYPNCPQASATRHPYHFSLTLPSLIDAALGNYSFDRMLHHVSQALARER